MSQLDPSAMTRRQQIAESYRITKQAQPNIPFVLAGTFVLGALIGGGLFWLLPGSGILGWAFTIIGALLGAFLFTVIIFGRQAQKAAYARIEGQPGAAMGALNMLKRGWNSEPAVAFNKHQDLVHRVVGPPGIVLIGEGNPNRVKTLLADQRRKHERVVVDVPIHEIIVGNDEGQVPLAKLSRAVMKLGRHVRGADITDILNRLKALDAVQGKVPMPKGPVPTSMKGMRGNLRGR
ncbi:DUF4191 domain-containing protein [Nocardioides sp.]|uniref:DUF4191 domain-containing protein n=1 Tax=Nocardioides sp. TaxID=35761 RepID=UPI00261D840D|nr:DUF4191 domain-containing protein [Nocardioides sp.]